MTAEEQNDIIALTESQIKGIRDTDAKAQKDFLETEPKAIDAGLKSNEAVARILNTWGK